MPVIHGNRNFQIQRFQPVGTHDNAGIGGTSGIGVQLIESRNGSIIQRNNLGNIGIGVQSSLIIRCILHIVVERQDNAILHILGNTTGHPLPVPMNDIGQLIGGNQQIQLLVGIAAVSRMLPFDFHIGVFCILLIGQNITQRLCHTAGSIGDIQRELDLFGAVHLSRRSSFAGSGGTGRGCAGSRRFCFTAAGLAAAASQQQAGEQGESKCTIELFHGKTSVMI